MGDYYNTTRGPLSVTLNDGSAASVTPKKWFYVSQANEGSASLQKLLEKGFLVRAKVAITPENPTGGPTVEQAAAAAAAAASSTVAPVAPAKMVETSVSSEKGEMSAPAGSAKGDKFGGKSR